MVKFINKEVSGLPVIEWAKGKPTCVVAHETANNGDKGSYDDEINFMSNNWWNAFVHTFTAENGTAVVHDPDIGGAWGAGPSMHHNGIHCELCRSSTKEGFLKSYKNWVETLVHYAKKYDIPIVFNSGNKKVGILTHHYVTKTWGGTTHVDPDAYLDRWGVSINQLGNDIKSLYDDGRVTVKPLDKPKHPVVVDEDSIVDYLEAKDMDASFDNREKLATEYGINDYVGTADQNIELLNLLQTKSPSKASDYSGNSIVEYLKSINEDASFINRSRLADKHGINGYKGTADQNLELLNKLNDETTEQPSEQKHRTVYLPANINQWKVYKLNDKPVTENAEWALTPSRYGGLTYKILDEPYPNVVTIMTSRGKRNIYVAWDTGAVIK